MNTEMFAETNAPTRRGGSVFLPVSSDVQVLELSYDLYPALAQQQLSFAKCTDISLGLIETRDLRGVLTAQPSLLNREAATVTLRRISIETAKDAVVLKLEPLQEMQLHFEANDAVIDAVPLLLAATTAYSNLIQHLFMARLEHVLSRLNAAGLSIEPATEPIKTFAETLRLRGYESGQKGHRKALIRNSSAWSNNQVRHHRRTRHIKGT